MDSRETQATIRHPTPPQPRIRRGESGGAGTLAAPERSGGERWNRGKKMPGSLGGRGHRTAQIGILHRSGTGNSLLEAHTCARFG